MSSGREIPSVEISTGIIIEQHPIVGERICSPLRAFRLVLPIIRHHQAVRDNGE